MPLKPLHLVCARAEDAFAPCVDYVVRLLAHVYRWEARCGGFADAAAFLRASARPRLLLVYDDAKALKKATQLEADYDVMVLIERSGFFGPQFLKQPDLPEPPAAMLEFASRDHHSAAMVRCGEHAFRVNFDIIASAFWLLTRYEEYVISTPDEHGRFLCAHSMAPPEVYDAPLVNRWFENLFLAVRNELWAEDSDSSIGARQTMVLTHDVDLMRKYRGLRGARRALSSMVQSPVGDATGEMRFASLVLAGIRRDPFDSFDQLFSLKERVSAPSTFFLMGGGRTPYDCDYSLGDTHVRDLISRIRMAGDEIGLHPSYDSFRSEHVIRAECSAVAEAAGLEIRGSRQHYLRFVVPETWRALAGCGLRYDSSITFADRAGFRCGWSGCFHPFDIDRRVELPLVEIPLVVMDMTLAVYEKVPAEQSIERLAKLLEASATRGGAFVLLWHNVLRDARVYPGYWDSLEYFVFAAAGNARFTTLGRLCDEFTESAT